MKSLHHFESSFKANFTRMRMKQQRGLVLFLALIALVIMSMAAVALIRSVDTNTLIAGNVAFKQAATTSADAGVEAAIIMLVGMRDDPANAGKQPISDPTHTFNVTNTAARPGYFSNADPALILTSAATWTGANVVNVTWDSAGVAKSDGTGTATTDNSGNAIQYIVQRMCRTANVQIQNADCLFGTPPNDLGSHSVPLPKNICNGDGCPPSGATPQMRITVRVVGPKLASSYIQTFVY
jgi:Tfp pilus assembly protein PilX